jgi:hypothetical protein
METYLFYIWKISNLGLITQSWFVYPPGYQIILRG